VVASQSGAPWIFPDELVYTHLARSFAATGHFAVREEPFSAWSFGPLYPILIAPIYRFATPTTAYFLIKTANAVLFSLAAVPAYFLARRVLSRKSALILAAGAVFVPSAIYASKVMTESLAYPLFLLAAVAVVRVLEAPTAKREVAAIAAIALAALARGQLIVLFPAFLSTLVVVSILDRREEGRTADVRRLWRVLAAYRIIPLTAVLAGAGLVAASVTGLSGKLAGGHGEAFAGVDLSALAASFLNHLAELDLYLGFLPFAATAMVCATAFGSWRQDRSLRIVCTFTISVTLFLAAAAARYLVAVYGSASNSSIPVFDRYVFYAAPLFLIGFLVWLERGLPRPSRRIALSFGIAAAALPLVLPFGDLLNDGQWGTNSSTVGLVPLGILRAMTGSLLAVYGALILGGAYLAYLFLRSKSPRELVLVVGLNLAVLNLFAQAGNSVISERALRLGIGDASQRSWVDDAAGTHARVAALWSGTGKPAWKGWYAIWENEFFNASVRGVYRLREPMQYALPVTQLQMRGRDLYLPGGKRFLAQYVLTDKHTALDAMPVAADAVTRMVLYRVDGPVRLQRSG
jgi:hypothetical protein